MRVGKEGEKVQSINGRYKIDRGDACGRGVAGWRGIKGGNGITVIA